MTPRTGCESESTLHVRVQPKSSSNRVVLEDAGRVRIAVTAPPADGAANQAVCQLIAKSLGIAKSRVRVMRGTRSREKVIHVDGLAEEEALRRLSAI